MNSDSKPNETSKPQNGGKREEVQLRNRVASVATDTPITGVETAERYGTVQQDG